MKKVLAIIEFIFLILIAILFVIQVLIICGIVNFGGDVIFQDIHTLIYIVVLYIVYILYSLVILILQLFIKKRLHYKNKILLFLIMTSLTILSFIVLMI